MTAQTTALTARWIARVWSILSISLVVLFAIGEAGGGPRPTPQEWVGLALWPIGVCVGLALAWYWEEVGAALSLLCLLAFYVWNLLRSGHLPGGPFFFLVAAPSLPFMLSGILFHRTPRGIRSCTISRNGDV